MCETKYISAFKSRGFRYTLINTLSVIFTDICKENDINPIINNKNISLFLTDSIQTITINDYLQRLVKYTQVESSTLIAMLIYIDRLCELNNFIVNSYNVYKILFSSLIMAIKYNEDEFYDNKFYAKVGGLSLKEMNNLEINYLSLIDFKLYISEEVFDTYFENLVDAMQTIINN
jgi:hypothetical protein